MRSKKYLFFLFLLTASFFCFSQTVRHYLTTGHWYPREPKKLNLLLDRLFVDATPCKTGLQVRGLVVPHAGLAYSGKVAASAYVNLRHCKKISRVILLGVSHRGGFYGGCVSAFDFNATPLGRIAVDRRITTALGREKLFFVNNRVMQQEHSLENQLPFLQRVLPAGSYKIVPVLFGSLRPGDFDKAAEIIARHVSPETVVIASTDMTHYGKAFDYLPFTRDVARKLHRLDRSMIRHITELDLKGYLGFHKKSGITMCGFVPVAVWMNLFSRSSHQLILTDYLTSGDLSGNYDLSVGYAGIAAYEKKQQLLQKEQKILLNMARNTLRDYLLGKKKKLPPRKNGLPAALKKTAGVFVTLKKGKQLRGCIGSVQGRQPLFKGVMENVLHAALRDPRFPPVNARELKDITIEISVMTPLQKISDYHRIRLGTDGVILRRGYASAVFLPQVATETGWSLERFLARLSMKAGLDAEAFKRPGTEFLVFQAQVFHEKTVP